MMRDMVARFANEQVAPHVMTMDKEKTMRSDVIQGMFDAGLMAIELEEEFGGAGASFVSAVIAIEELAKVDASVSVCCDVQNTLVVTGLRQWGSDELKQRWLPRLATDTVGSFCLSEAGSGSDAFALATRAVPDADGKMFTLNGSKMWITNGGEAGVYLVFANVDPSAGYKGITCFVVPRDTPGLDIGPREDKLGIRASSTTPVHLTDVRVPREAVLGEIGHGYKYAIQTLNEGRIGIGAQMLGIAQGAFDATMRYTLERQQFGQRIIDFQAMEHQAAEVALEIEAARLLVYNAARLRGEGKPFVKQAAMAKLAASRVAERAASQGINMAGGVGLSKEYPFEKFYRDQKIGQVYEGTTNVQLSTIAKALKNEHA